jgi:hypothetical protein
MPVARRHKYFLCLSVKGARVNPFADRHGGNNLASVSVNHRHHFVVAAGKQAPVVRVERQCTGLFARR